MRYAFIKLAPNVWIIDSPNEKLKSTLLQKIPFEKIVALLKQNAKIISIRRNRKDKRKTLFRAIITIAVDRKALNLFYNSCCGYRAQYYYGVSVGKAANKYTISKFLPLIKAFLKQYPKRTCPYDWVVNALVNGDAKVWIHQGKWLRYSKSIDRILQPRRWRKEVEKASKKERKKKLRWGSLIPNKENKIEIKGTFRKLTGRKSKAKQKNRGLEIHSLLYT